VRFTAAARFGRASFRAPRTELAAFEGAPEIWVQDPVLELRLGRAHGLSNHDGHKDASDRDAVGMHVEKPENSGSGKTERVQHGAGFSGVSSGKSTTNFMPPPNPACDARRGMPNGHPIAGPWDRLDRQRRL